LVHAQEQAVLKTGDTSLTVTASVGQMTITSLSSPAGAPEWTPAPVPVSLPNQVFINNASQSLN
jgi:hypothetical protein